ncbi:MAG: hypothetical protein IJ552_01905 [Prevotella sp.]|nr:hypothetical protein [Prevotella sp.]
MKQFKLTFLLTVLMSMVGAKANAHDFDVDGIYYNITSAKDYTVAVSYKGSDFKSYEEYTGSIIIPESVIYNGTTYIVTSIGRSAFSRCSGLTSYAEGVFLSRRVYNSNLVVFICSLVANVAFIILTVILWLNK